MYKVFFKDRTVYFCDDFLKVFVKNKGLFYRYTNQQELQKLINAFYTFNQIRNLYIFHEDMLALLDHFKSCFRIIEAGGGLVMNRQGEFLVIRRKGMWDLPKGKLEKDEDFAAAALREVKEETGLHELHITNPVTSTYHTYKLSEEFILKKTRWFEMSYRGNEEPRPEAREEITEAKWVVPGSTDFIRQCTYPSILDVMYIKGVL